METFILILMIVDAVIIILCVSFICVHRIMRKFWFNRRKSPRGVWQRRKTDTQLPKNVL